MQTINNDVDLAYNERVRDSLQASKEYFKQMRSNTKPGSSLAKNRSERLH